MKFRKKSVVIEAFRWDPNLASWPDWFDDFPDKTVNDNGTVSILTLEGVMTVNRSDYILCGVKGEIYPCKPDIFAATYEPV